MTLYPESQDYGYFEYWTVPEDKWFSLPDEPTDQQWDEYTAYRKANTFDYEVPRNDKDLIEVIEELGSEAASAEHAELHIVEIPDGVDWVIENDEFGNELPNAIEHGIIPPSNRYSLVQCARCLTVKRQPSKLATRVQLLSRAPCRCS